ncbi:hypothetical protein [Sphaerothrix gracilis]|uniref:hypothetical protein n=1 Tax=Sphaerothrix gracilis TaxID=3151835 RepID=UPI0031FD1CDC
MPRTGGNPELAKHQYQKRDPSRAESYTEKLYLRVTPSMKQALSDGALPDWQDIVRQKLEEELTKNVDQ